MKRAVVRMAFLNFAILAFSCSAFPAMPTANASPSSLQDTLVTQSDLLKAHPECSECVNFKVTVFFFEPGPLVKVTNDLSLFKKSLSEQGMPQVEGFPLYLNADSKKVAAAFSPYGKFTQMFYSSVTTVRGDPVPFKTVNDESGFEGLLMWSPTTPGSKQGLVSYDFKVTDSSRMAGGSGRVLFSKGSSVLEVYKLDSRYVVLLVQADIGSSGDQLGKFLP